MDNKDNFTEEELRELPKLISVPRFSRYLQATSNDPSQALRLYQWNLEVSGELLKVLHLCEIGLRNGIVDAIVEVHGDQWPWVQGFRVSLQNSRRGYSPRRDLESVAAREPTPGKIIAELKFAFWERMLNASHQNRLWDQHLNTSFPHVDLSEGSTKAREEIRNKIFVVRDLRNRIAHHEPIFYRPSLESDFASIMYLIEARCPVSADWISRLQNVSAMLAQRPET